MATSLWDATGTREYKIDCDFEKHGNSVFISGPGGFCVEFNREEMIQHMKREYLLVESLDLVLSRILEAA